MIAALALLPWFFSWTGVILYLLGVHVFGVLGINVCYHRLLTHRGFACPLWLEHALVVLGVCSMQDSPSFWVAAHRRHHQFADQEGDPHTPLAGFFWAHVGWMLVKPDDPTRDQLIQRYVKDLNRDPFYVWLDQSNHAAYVALLSWLVFFAAGFAAMVLTGTHAVGLYTIWPEPSGLGRRAAHGRSLASDMGRQFGDPRLGLSQLRIARCQPQQCS